MPPVILDSFLRKVDGRFVHTPLSNFYIEPDGTNVESEFQCNKSLNPFVQSSIVKMPPGQAKKWGRKITLRPDWEDIKLELMYQLVHCKFSDHDKLRGFLMTTSDFILVEGNNWHDNFYGNCVCYRCTNIEGKNWLGKILMEVRKELRR